MDNSRSVIDGSWRIFTRIRGVTITRLKNYCHQGLEHYRKKLKCPCRALHLLGDAHFTPTAGVAPDVPRHGTASTRPNPSVEEAFDNTHAKGAQGTKSRKACVDSIYTDKDSIHTSEEETQVIEIPKDMPRRYPLHRSASPEPESYEQRCLGAPGLGPDRLYGSPPQNQWFYLTNVSWLLGTTEGFYETFFY